MATYNSLTNVTEGTMPEDKQFAGKCTIPLVWPTKTFTPGKPNVVRDYVPVLTREWRNDPTRSYNRQWSRIKSSGQISMTPLSVGKTSTRQYVVSRDFTRKDWERRQSWCSMDNVCSPAVIREAVTTWTENDHLGSLSLLFHANSDSSAADDFNGQITEAIHSTQSAAFANSLSSYDVLTELAEGRETLSFLTSKVKDAANALEKLAYEDEPTWKRARGFNAKQLTKSTDKALRRLGSRWMEYRYAIMPIVYSMKDINDLLGKRTEVYKTDRDRSNISVSLEAPSSLPELCVYSTGNWNATVRSTVKSAYNRGALQRVLSQTSFNPFKTAWELIPYSFVIDWFLNVGDVITSHTGLDLSSQKVCCTAVKKTSAISTYLHDYRAISMSATWGSNVCGPGDSRNYNHQMTTNGLLQEVVLESYDRFLWTKPEPRLTFDPFLNWKRFLDSLVLGYQPTKNLLRSL